MKPHLQFSAYALLSLALLSGSSVAQSAPGLLGLWLSQDGRDVTEILPCGTTLCGRLVQAQGLRPDDRDTRNPNPTLRSAPLCNQVYMGGFKRESDARWVSGWVYDSRDGGSYTNVSLESKGELLELTVRVGFIRHTERMTRLDPVKVTRCGTADNPVRPLGL
ncbi:MAG: DUF2147 domain-containing protein [Pseudomonadota bacterium]